MTLRWSNGHRTFVTLTDLNRATSAAYDRCQMTGGHTPSGETVSRRFPIGDRELPICRRCGVPFGGPRSQWTTHS